jgi:uncharacterized protein with PIN domain
MSNELHNNYIIDKFNNHKDNIIMNNIFNYIKEKIKKQYNIYPNEIIIMTKILEIFDNLGNNTINRCIECNRDIGPNNPRQYCNKGYCNFY